LSQQLKPIVDKLGFLLHATTVDYCHKRNMSQFTFLDWGRKEEQYYMRLFMACDAGQAWMKDPKNQDYIEKYCDGLGTIYPEVSKN